MRQSKSNGQRRAETARATHLRHGLSVNAVDGMADILVHHRREDGDNKKSQNAGRAGRPDNTQRYRFSCMQRLLAHVDARVEEPDRPDGRQPGQNKRPAGRPVSEIVDMPKNIGTRVEVPRPRHLADRQRNHGGDHEDQVEVNTGRLDLGHDGSGKDGAQPVYHHYAREDPVNNPVRRRPFSVAGDRDAREEHEGEGV